MVVFHTVCRIGRSSSVHRTESVSVIGQDTVGGGKFHTSDQKQQN